MTELLSMDTQDTSDCSEYARTKDKISAVCQSAKDEGLTKHLDIEDISVRIASLDTLTQVAH